MIEVGKWYFVRGTKLFGQAKGRTPEGAWKLWVPELDATIDVGPKALRPSRTSENDDVPTAVVAVNIGVVVNCGLGEWWEDIDKRRLALAALVDELLSLETGEGRTAHLAGFIDKAEIIEMFDE